MVEFSKKMTKEDYLAFQKFVFKKTVKALIVLFVTIVLLAVVFFLNNQILNACYAFGGYILFVALMYFMIRHSINKQWQTNKSLQAFETYIFDVTEFTVKSFDGEKQTGLSVIKYSDLFQVISTAKYYFIYISNLQAYIINKENVGDNLNELNSILFINCKIKTK